jgi:hypothetical protein
MSLDESWPPHSTSVRRFALLCGGFPSLACERGPGKSSPPFSEPRWELGKQIGYGLIHFSHHSALISNWIPFLV